MILYEDKEIIVCHKAAGIAVQSARIGMPDMESTLKNYLVAKNPGKMPYLGVVHRLDQPVQGLVVFARNPGSAASLSAQAQNGCMKKYYQAVTCGIPEKKSDRLIDYLKKNGKTNLSEVVSSKTAGAKKAELQYHILKEKEQMALAEIELFTGRHHQIRVQMAANGTPLYGDQKYNPQAKKGEMIALCAHRLQFIHPATGKRMEFTVQPSGSAFELLEV